MAALGYLVGLGVSKSKNKLENLDSKQNKQYANRLKEFFIDDYSMAMKKYSQFIKSGLSPQQSFDILTARFQLQELTIGEFND